MVHLDVLAGRDVALVERHVALDDVGERLHLLRRDPAERQLDAHYLHARLALAVHALLQAEADELVLRRLAVEELRRLGLEVLELALEDRDDAPGDVLQDLRVVERPRPAGGPLALEGGWFHGGRLQKGAGRPSERRNIPKARSHSSGLEVEGRHGTIATWSPNTPGCACAARAASRVCPSRRRSTPRISRRRRPTRSSPRSTPCRSTRRRSLGSAAAAPRGRAHRTRSATSSRGRGARRPRGCASASSTCPTRCGRSSRCWKAVQSPPCADGPPGPAVASAPSL